MSKDRTKILEKNLPLGAPEQAVGTPLKRRVLRNMPGAWSKREAAEFDRFLVQQRRIDLARD